MKIKPALKTAGKVLIGLLIQSAINSLMAYATKKGSNLIK